MSDSFLTQGRYARPALALGFDPVAVVQRAFVTGALVATGPKPGPTWREVATARNRNLMRRLRATRKAAGLNQTTGRPLKNRSHPELRGLSRKEYNRRYMAKARATLNSQLPHSQLPQ